MRHSDTFLTTSGCQCEHQQMLHHRLAPTSFTYPSTATSLRTITENEGMFGYPGVKATCYLHVRSDVRATSL